jgi:hypothetical protein
MIMAETLKKAAEATAKAQQKVAAAVASARTRKGEPKVTKPPPKEEPAAPEPVDVAERLDAFIAYETDLLAAVAVPEDTGDAMFNAVQAVLYHKERITKAELAKKYLTED